MSLLTRKVSVTSLQNLSSGNIQDVSVMSLQYLTSVAVQNIHKLASLAMFEFRVSSRQYLNVLIEKVSIMNLNMCTLASGKGGDPERNFHI